MFLQERVDLLVYYLHEREKIRIKKTQNLPKPWTGDKILKNYKFTNVLRSQDRTSQWLIENWYTPNFHAPARDVLLNAVLARYFGSITFAKLRGWSTVDDFYEDDLIEQCDGWICSGKKLFTGAYVITNGGISGPKHEVIVQNYIAPLVSKIDVIVEHFGNDRRWQPIAEQMMREPGFGGTGFMTKEVLSDCQYTNWMKNPSDRYTWSPIGPGALRGLNRMLGNEPKPKLRGALDYMRELYNLVLPKLDPSLIQGAPDGEWDLHGLQFALCELDKYVRVQNGEGTPRSRYNGA